MNYPPLCNDCIQADAFGWPRVACEDCARLSLSASSNPTPRASEGASRQYLAWLRGHEPMLTVARCDDPSLESAEVLAA